MLPIINLKPGKEQAVKRFHPWVFSGAISKFSTQPDDGDIVKVCSAKGEFLGIGHYATGSIAVRIFSFFDVEIDNKFWLSKIYNAFKLREALLLTANSKTNSYRLIHGEADGVPGLIVDIYNDVAVVQAHTKGVFNIIEDIADAIKEIYGTGISTVYSKSSETLHNNNIQNNISNRVLIGNSESVVILENNNKFLVDFIVGQKTGFFLDQRDNRALLAEYSKNKKVLNTFCYSGGFSIYALNAGASQVWSIDSSKKAIELTQKNIELNNFDIIKNPAVVSDTLEFLKTSDENFDVIVLDPPAYAKHLDAKHKAVQGYKRLNALAMTKISKGGIIFTFSCSQVIDKKLFADTIMAASIESGRNIRILHRLSQPADHPVSIYHPEGEYLKGLVLYVD